MSTVVRSDFFSLDPSELVRFLERRKAHYTFEAEIDLDSFLREILAKAEQFVPSEAGSILLDDPLSKGERRESNDLVFIAAFGERAAGVVGRRISASIGIAGHVYLNGDSYRGTSLDEDPYFYKGLDEETRWATRSVLCVPIRIEKSICGALELINRAGADSYSQKDLELLTIFAEYTSMSIRNVLDARRAHEIAKRDDLTGLFNDRFFHLQLSIELMNAERDSKDLALIFFDLDNFKKVNDSYGHLAGSQVLKEVGYLLRKVVSWPGAILSRYGGDEFVAILPAASLEDGRDAAEEIREAIGSTVFLSREYGFNEPPVFLRDLITCSAGVASRLRHVPVAGSIDQQKNEILRRADTAMYAAKDQGKDRVLVAE
jgi:diguanylate cyclase (GGDEF)-like protein